VRRSSHGSGGYDAIRDIGCALDDDDPTVLANMNDLTKGMLLARI
jgi:hypothetical protein